MNALHKIIVRHEKNYVKKADENNNSKCYDQTKELEEELELQFLLKPSETNHIFLKFDREVKITSDKNMDQHLNIFIPQLE